MLLSYLLCVFSAVASADDGDLVDNVTHVLVIVCARPGGEPWAGRPPQYTALSFSCPMYVTLRLPLFLPLLTLD